jgi:hypothetical protein
MVLKFDTTDFYSSKMIRSTSQSFMSAATQTQPNPTPIAYLGYFGNELKVYEITTNFILHELGTITNIEKSDGRIHSLETSAETFKIDINSQTIRPTTRDSNRDIVLSDDSTFSDLKNLEKDDIVKLLQNTQSNILFIELQTSWTVEQWELFRQIQKRPQIPHHEIMTQYSND